MGAITRSPEECQPKIFDLIVVGGGIYGAAALWETARRLKSALLLEKDDFGGATSYNSHRIIHGGFRYLQSGDLPRFWESVHERRWFLSNWPGLVQPLPCLLPLYAGGRLRSPIIWRAATWVNGILSARRNRGVPVSHRLRAGTVLSRSETAAALGGAQVRELVGGGTWDDASIPHSQRLIVEMLRAACGSGCAAMNYARVKDLARDNEGTDRHRWIVVAEDRETGRLLQFRARYVLNAAGPWCRELAASWGDDCPALFPHPVLLWNVLFDRKPISQYALALYPERDGKRAYFFHPWQGKMLIGTGQSPFSGSVDRPQVTPRQIVDFVADLNRCLPGLELEPGEILQVFSGVVPGADAEGEVSERPVFIDHGTRGGLDGVFSVSGVKFTTARRQAERALNRIFPSAPAGTLMPEHGYESRGLFGSEGLSGMADLGNPLSALIREESVMHLSDLVFRRTDLGDHPQGLRDLCQELTSLFPWDSDRRESEVRQTVTYLKDRMEPYGGTRN